MGSIRITGGELGGRLIRTLGGTEMRPTAAKVREAIFSVLHRRCPGSLVLDLFCGSGALGIEALSRGAKSSTFLDKHPSAVRALRDNLREIDLEERALVLKGEADRFLLAASRRDDAFDIVLADPPYSYKWRARLVRRVLEAGLLLPSGLMVLEHPRAEGFSLEMLENIVSDIRVETRQYGGTGVTYFRLGQSR